MEYPVEERGNMWECLGLGVITFGAGGWCVRWRGLDNMVTPRFSARGLRGSQEDVLELAVIEMEIEERR